MSPAQLEAAITPRTRWLIVNSPSNPTGATYSMDEFAALAAMLERHPHVMVMTDDIYEHIRFEGGTAPHLLAAAPALKGRTLAINGVSKTYAMTAGASAGSPARPTSSAHSTRSSRRRPATAARSARRRRQRR